MFEKHLWKSDILISGTLVENGLMMLDTLSSGLQINKTIDHWEYDTSTWNYFATICLIILI